MLGLARFGRPFARAWIALEISRRNARVKALQNRSNRMRQIIDECGASAQFGDVPGEVHGVLTEAYVGQSTRTTLRLLCDEMNGEPLPPEHGFPVRLIAPGWYGVASVKCLTRIR